MRYEKEQEYGKGATTDAQVFMDRLSEAVRKEIYERHISMDSFAELQDVGRNIIAEIANGKKNDVSLSTLFKICDKTSISIVDLLCGYEEKNRGSICEK